MSKLSVQSSNQNRPFKPNTYQGRRRGQGRNNYYDRGRQWGRFQSHSSDRYRRSNYRDRPKYGQNYRERSQYGQKYTGENLRRGHFRGAQNYIYIYMENHKFWKFLRILLLGSLPYRRLRQAVERVKRIPTYEKIDRQLAERNITMGIVFS